MTKTNQKLEAVLAEGEGEGEIASFEGTLGECIEWAERALGRKSSGYVEISDPETGECLKSYPSEVIKSIKGL